MRKKIKGMALLQALFFMMFIMAIISITMMMSAQHQVSVTGERMAIDALPAIRSFILSQQSSLAAGTVNIAYASDYFQDNPLSTGYLDLLSKDGFSNPALCGTAACNPNHDNVNLTITVT